MTERTRFVLLWTALLLVTGCAAAPAAVPVPALPAHRQCVMADDDRRWLSVSLAGWRHILRDMLNAPAHPLPAVVAYDASCSYTLEPHDGASGSWTVAEHRGTIGLPSGATIPPGPNAFNAVTDSGHNFVVIGLPSIWRPVAPKSEIPLDWFLEGVLFHELAHSYQSAVTPAVSFPALLKQPSVPANVNDDSVQDAFGANADYVRAFEAERDLLFAAASATDEEPARALACEALGAMRSRRSNHFGGANAHWARVDEISLTTEGLGQWVAYSWLTEGRALPPALVLQKLRGPYWSQEEGLALFLTVDRLVSGWQRLLFAPAPATGEDLLARACGG